MPPSDSGRTDDPENPVGGLLALLGGFLGLFFLGRKLGLVLLVGALFVLRFGHGPRIPRPRTFPASRHGNRCDVSALDAEKAQGTLGLAGLGMGTRRCPDPEARRSAKGSLPGPEVESQ